MSSSEQQVLNALDGLGMPYDAISIDPAFADTAAFCEKYNYPPHQSCNAIIVASKKEPKKYAACLVLATTRLDVNKRVTKLLGVSKASFATAEEMMALTGMQVGGVTPFALPEGLPIFVDQRVMECDWVIIGGGGRSLKIKVSPQVLLKLGAQPIEQLALE